MLLHIVEQLTHGLEHRYDQQRLAPGDPAPDFTLATDTGEQVSLADLRGGR